MAAPARRAIPALSHPARGGPDGDGLVGARRPSKRAAFRASPVACGERLASLVAGAQNAGMHVHLIAPANEDSTYIKPLWAGTLAAHTPADVELTFRDDG